MSDFSSWLPWTVLGVLALMTLLWPAPSRRRQKEAAAPQHLPEDKPARVATAPVRPPDAAASAHTQPAQL